MNTNSSFKQAPSPPEDHFQEIESNRKSETLPRARSCFWKQDFSLENRPFRHCFKALPKGQSWTTGKRAIVFPGVELVPWPFTLWLCHQVPVDFAVWASVVVCTLPVCVLMPILVCNVAFIFSAANFTCKTKKISLSICSIVLNDLALKLTTLLHILHSG